MLHVLQYWLSSLQRDYNNYDGDIWQILTVPATAMLSFISTISALFMFDWEGFKHSETNEFDERPAVKSICASSLAVIGSTVICTFILIIVITSFLCRH